jgi:hypothetical protein
MIERHYAKYIATALEDLARAAIVPLIMNPSEDTAKPAHVTSTSAQLMADACYGDAANVPSS